MSVEDLEIYQAWMNGSKIECRIKGHDTWVEISNPGWNFDNCDYRIKTEDV